VYEYPLSKPEHLLVGKHHGFGHSLGPKKISFEDTSTAFDVAFRKYVTEGIWSRLDVKLYLELFCIAPSLVEQFLCQSQRHMTGKEVEDKNSDSF
jgi:hypothetical protein